MVERVVALVSRVQGTYEFEVQPLREYFAAKYLYETAPYSPLGHEQQGTKPDRFKAIAGNFYWLNVTRFYAGLYSKGELPSLVDGLVELTEESGYRDINLPRSLASTLLADWVFAQDPRSVRKVAHLVFEEPDIRFLLTASDDSRPSNNALVLPISCGRNELIARCMSALSTRLQSDRVLALTNLLKQNAKLDERRDLWIAEISKVSGSERTKWFWFGVLLGALSQLDQSQISQLLGDDHDKSRRLNYLALGGQVAYCESDNERCAYVVHAILQGNLRVTTRDLSISPVTAFSTVLDPVAYERLFHFPEPIPLNSISLYGTEGDVITSNLIKCAEDNDVETIRNCAQVLAVAREEWQRTAHEWATDISPWDNIVEASRSVWGEQWIHYAIANVGCRAKAPASAYKSLSDLFDHSTSLCRRALLAKSSAKSADWWKEQMDAAVTEMDKMFVTLLLLTWATRDTVNAVLDRLEFALDSLSPAEWYRLVDTIEESLLFREGRSSKTSLPSLDSLPTSLSPRTATVLGMRISEANATSIYGKYLVNYDGHDSAVLKFCQAAAVSAIRTGLEWSQALDTVKDTYAKGEVAYRHALRFSEQNPKFIPMKAAEAVVRSSSQYPLYLTRPCEARCREAITRKIRPVADIANEEKWFSRDS